MDKLYKSIPFLIAVIGVFSCQQWIEIPVSNQYLTWICEVGILGVFLYMGYRCRAIKTYRMPWPIALYLFMIVISAIYGLFSSEGYWDYKLLISNFFAYSLGIGYFYFIQPSKVLITLKVWMLFSAFFFIAFIPFMYESGAMFLLPISFILLFSPFLGKKARAFVITLALIAVLSGTLGARSSILRFFFCFVLAGCIALRRVFPKSAIKAVVLSEFILPFILIILAVTGAFNVFEIGDSIGASSIELEESADGVTSLGADTRSFIYFEEIQSSLRNNYYIQGRSLARGYDSDFFQMADDGMMGRGERGSSEVSILNLYNYCGLVGVVIFFILLSAACLNAIRKGKSKTIQFIAVYIGYRWIWAFVEDPIVFNMNSICLWIAISMCFSPFFCEMTDAQFEIWVKSSYARFFRNHTPVLMSDSRKSE